MEKLLSGDNFLRIHKSFIVNRDKISAYNAREVELGDISLPVGRIYKEMVEKQMGTGK